ncbi:MAG: type III pantothenate kinase [Actinomycetia bacterium]|nr:type III pantothenate kinase [Actinomycetes bacterium]
MLLAVDVGNTQTCLGLYDGRAQQAAWRISTVATDTADELAIRVHNLLEKDSLAPSFVSDLAISSVVPTLTEQWRLAASRLVKQPPLILNSQVAAQVVRIDYPNPEEIGADRIAVAVAALELYGPPVVVVDFGTATNIEVINREGAFIGGIICPGLATSAEALFQAAARLTRIAIEVPPQVIGKSTAEAVRSGLTFGEIDRIDGLVRRVFRELGYTAQVVATGGLSLRVAGLSQTIDTVNDDLTLIGLQLIYERVAGPSA